MIDEQKATELWNNGLLDKEICERLGYNRKTFAKWRKGRGMESNYGIFGWDNNPHKTHAEDREVVPEAVELNVSR